MAKLYGAVLLKAKDILDYIVSSPDAPTLNDLSQNLDISKPTILKILKTLEYCNYISCSEMNGSKHYYLGTVFLRYAEKVNESFDIINLVLPYLKELRDASKESINLGIPRNNEVLILKKLEVPLERGIKLVSQVGGTMPLYSSSMGKAILSNFSKVKLNDYLKNTKLIRQTENTITSADKLKEELKLTRENGYSIDNSENQEGIFCIGFDLKKNDHLLGAFSISTLRYTMDKEKLDKLSKLGKKTQQKIIENL